MKKVNLVVFALTIFLGFASSCKKSDDSSPGGYGSGYNNPTMGSPGANEVWMQNIMFNPSTITIAVNTTVRWTNKDAVAHTVTSDTDLFDSGTINSGGIYSHQFTTTGTFPYHCTLHTGMTGTVVVN